MCRSQFSVQSSRQIYFAICSNLWPPDGANRWTVAAVRRVSQAQASGFAANQVSTFSAKKRPTGEPSGSLAAIIAAAAQPSSITAIDIKTRNAAVNSQLAAKRLRAVDTDGDGNCFFRALSYCLYQDQRQHTTLRASIASYVSRQADVALPEDKDSLRKRAAEVAKDKFWPGEDIILASANFLQQTIQVYLAHGISSPISYSPSTTSSKSPLSIAFFEPGHYKAVVPSSLSCNSSRPGGMTSCDFNCSLNQ